MTKTEEYITHLEASIANAEVGSSKLPEGILEIRGMSSPKVRHLLNNINSLPDTNYLEVGCWQGSTLCSALYGNSGAAYAVDEFVQDFDKYEDRPVKDLFFENLSAFSLKDKVEFFNQDCFSLDLSRITSTIDVYFYDGAHGRQEQEKALTYFNPVLADTFIYVVDDWRDAGEGVDSGATIGTFQAISKGFDQLFYTELPRGSYHMGLGLFVLGKK